MLKGSGSALALGLLALSGLTCGDGGGAETASAFVQSFCGVLKPCCTMAGLPGNGLFCTVGAGVVPGYNKQAGAACLAELRAAAAKSDFCQNVDGNMPASCDAAFEETNNGSKKPGEACDDDEDCAASTEGKVSCETAFTGGAQIRKCQVQVKGKAGDMPCVGTIEGNTTFYNNIGTDVLPRGYLCDLAAGVRCDSASDACVALKTVGEACSGSSNECVTTAYCDTTQRKCAERKPAGAMCTTSFSQPQCGDGLYCSAAKACDAQVGNGAACSDDDQCRSGQCVNMKCDSSSSFTLSLFCGTK
jgi:hypothetical protein